MARDMSAPTGTVEVKNRIIDRWDFNLRTSPYEIKMTNNIVSNNATIRNNIEILSGDYNPSSGSTGFIDLKIQEINTVCNAPSTSSFARKSGIVAKNLISSSNLTKLYPNPFNGLFSIILNNQHSKDVSVNIFDVLGKSVYDSTTNETTFNINVANIPSGLYFVKLTSESFNETLKFIKN